MVLPLSPDFFFVLLSICKLFRPHTPKEFSNAYTFVFAFSSKLEFRIKDILE